MPRKLATYRSMRDFETTPEPTGEGEAAAAESGRFVVQEHHATRLHWDLRLERDGVLASWAVPNGIPDDPADNRKAVRTEDHPLEYLDFEGDIPKGQYGAGTMRVWDRGTYECHKWEPRKVVVTFDGRRVRGRYALFQTGADKDWMIHRMDPPADAEREPMPERLVPMLAKLAELPRDDHRYGYEVKWDGIRAIAYSEPGRLRLETRNHTDVTARWPEIRTLNRELGSRSAVLDGEIVAFDDAGRPSFERLQQRMHLASESAVRRRARELPAVYLIFDLLYLDGRSLMRLPYTERRAVLEELALEGPAWRTPRYHPGDGAALLRATSAQGIEGIVAKRLDSTYEPGRRSGAWLKVKNVQRQELLIGGWFPGQGRRADRIGALLVGYFDRDDAGEPVLRYAGKVGTGFDERELDRLAGLLVPIRRETSPFEGSQPRKGALFVEPRLVAEIEFTEWTAQKMLRHPSYKGLRDDKDPREVVLEPANGAAPEEKAAAATRAGGVPAPTQADAAAQGLDALLAAATPVRGGIEVEVEGRRLKLSSLDKVLYPKTGFTKGQVIDYYARVAPFVLPHVRDRPLTLRRYHHGVEGRKFWEKQCPSQRPDWLETAPVWSEQKRDHIDYCLVQDLPSLLWSANVANIELHPSLALAADIARPTAVAFDLDPGSGTDLVDCCQVGLWLQAMFEQLGLDAFAKTSGSKGLQVYVPLNREASYAETKEFARAVAEVLERSYPDQVVSRMAKNLRRGKVFVDWSQNSEHKSTVCAYSLRARDRPTVSTAVTWEEVERAHAEGDAALVTFDPDQVLDRLEEHGDLFAPVLSLVQELPG